MAFPFKTVTKSSSAQQGQQTATIAEIQQANTFTAPSILRHSPTGWVKAKADTIANADIWLCTSATATSFRVATTCQTYNFPNHGLGDDNAVLLLSATVDGRLTTANPPTGAARVLLGIILDKDNILWSPSLRVETA